VRVINRVNDAIAVGVTNFVGSMWCAYLFASFAIYGADEGIKTLGFVNWFAEEFLQLVLLSVIMVGQNVQARKTDELIAHHHTLKEWIAKIEHRKEEH
jgi:hypothetical protein